MTTTRDTLWLLITSAHRLTRIAAQTTGDQTSPAVWRTLSILGSDGPLRLGELAAASRVAQPTMSKIVANLASDEWVRRIADVDDSRAWLIAITARGQEALDSWRDRVTEAAEPMFSGLSDAQWRVLGEAAELMHSRISAKEEAA